MRVLIVDDTPDVRFLLVSTLTLNGIDASEAEGGPQALDMLSSGIDVDVLLLDVQMPEMDGWQTLEAIRANPATAALPVVMCTVKSRPVDVLRGWEIGCDGYVTKPFDLDGLVRILNDAALRTPDERDSVRKREQALHRERLVRD